MKKPEIFQAGRNCWRVADAQRAAVLIDGAHYFAAFRAAVARARESILIVGWDLNSAIHLLRDGASHELPIELGAFLNHVVSRRRGLHAHVLIWDFAMIFAMDREVLPLYKMQWRTHRRLHFHMDDQHPVGGSHHQKIVVVDDAVAFVGGLDLSKHRWDTPEHIAHDSRRLDPDGESYTPFHDVQMIVDGEAAAALGELVRARWQHATGQGLEAPATQRADPWPPELAPDMRDVKVAIARTEPAYAGRPPVREVEQLYLDAIASARRSLYIENQYLTSESIGEALAKCLQEDAGPEIVLVLPCRCEGWLEKNTMDVLRARRLRRLREADRHGRLRVYYPHIPDLGEGCLHVHAKLMVVDDTLLRIGSANLSNRSMALDTECDLAIASGGDGRTEQAIVALRNRLLAEHLGVGADAVTRAVADHGSLTAAVESLRGPGRSLTPLDGEVPESLERTVPDAALIDPEAPLKPERLIEEFVPEEDREPTRRGLVHGLVFILILLALAAAWRWTPLGGWLDLDTLAGWAASLRGTALGPVVMIGGFLLGGLIAFPVTVMIVVAALVFGPLSGFLYALLGTLGSAVLTYGVGHVLGRATVRRVGGPRINRLSRRLAQRGLITMAVVRMLPIAPFTVVNMVAGASHIRFRDYLLGTLAGMVPGMLGLTVFADRMYDAVSNPEPGNFALLGGVMALLVAGAYFTRRWLGRRDTSGAPSS